VLVPVGAVEQHGPHLPMGVDHMITTGIARAVAKRIGGIVAPAITYGYKSQPRMGGGNHFCGTTSLDAATLVGVLVDIVRELARHGARRVAIVDGHYENMMFTIEAIDLALRELRYDNIDDMTIVRFEYWDFTRPETLDVVFPDGFPGWALEHAAVMETSLMLHMHPELVDMTKVPDDGPAQFPPHDVYPLRPGCVPCSGVLSPAHGATREKGESLFHAYVEDVSAALRAEFSLTA
jgi:creatinine amidohydrolase